MTREEFDKEMEWVEKQMGFPPTEKEREELWRAGKDKTLADIMERDDMFLGGDRS